MNLIAFEAEHLGDVVESDAVGIAVYEKKWRLGGFESVGSEICAPFQDGGWRPASRRRRPC